MRSAEVLKRELNELQKLFLSGSRISLSRPDACYGIIYNKYAKCPLPHAHTLPTRLGNSKTTTFTMPAEGRSIRRAWQASP